MSINQISVSGFFDILISKVGVPRNMQDVLCKWTDTMGKITSKFPVPFSFVVIPGMSSFKSAYPLNALKGKIYHLKSKSKIRKQLAPRQEIISPYEPQTNGIGPPNVNNNGSGFPGKIIALQHVFYLAVALKERGTKTVKVAKSKKNKSTI